MVAAATTRIIHTDGAGWSRGKVPAGAGTLRGLAAATEYVGCVLRTHADLFYMDQNHKAGRAMPRQRACVRMNVVLARSLFSPKRLAMSTE